MAAKTVSFFLALYGCVELSTTLKLKQVGVMEVKEPAFLGLLPNVTSGTTKYDLLISTFSHSPFTKGHVWGVPDVGKLPPGNWTPVLITDHLHWPNEVKAVPDDVFGKPGVISVAGGYYLPTKTDGGLFLIEGWPGKTGPPVDISGAQKGWFYHRVEWVDMDGDGRKDALTTRASANSLGRNTTGELVWFQQPKSNPTTTPSWKQHLIVGSPDFFFRAIELPVGGQNTTVIISCGFFSRELRVTWTLDPHGNWTNLTNVRTFILEGGFGRYFDAEVADFNGDGKMDLLVAVNSANDGYIVVHEIQKSMQNGSFKRRVIMSGYNVPEFFDEGKGSPGSAATFYQPKNGTEKPYILVSGADDGHLYIMTPHSEDPNDWRYRQDILYHGGGTVGEVLVADVNSDGTQEILLPCYSENKIWVYQVDSEYH